MQLRKINCTLQNARVEKGAWWVAMREASKEIASALIAGVIVVVVDKKLILYRFAFPLHRFFE